MTSDPWDDATVTAVARHMNDDHAAACLLLVQRLGDVPDATSARMTGMDPEGLLLAATVAGVERPARVAWPSVPVDRADVRAQVVALSAAAART